MKRPIIEKSRDQYEAEAKLFSASEYWRWRTKDGKGSAVRRELILSRTFILDVRPLKIYLYSIEKGIR